MPETYEGRRQAARSRDHGCCQSLAVPFRGPAVVLPLKPGHSGFKVGMALGTGRLLIAQFSRAFITQVGEADQGLLATDWVSQGFPDTKLG